jgi:hypothetical protein
MSTIIPELDDAQIRTFAAHAAGITLTADTRFAPLESEDDSALLVRVLKLRVWHANRNAIAEAGDFQDLSAPYASYVAPYGEHRGDARAAGRRAVAHTAARIGEAMLARERAAQTQDAQPVWTAFEPGEAWFAGVVLWLWAPSWHAARLAIAVPDEPGEWAYANGDAVGDGDEAFPTHCSAPVRPALPVTG